MKNQLFQEQALERLSSPEQLDRLMPLTSPRGWLALAGIGLLLLAGLVWSVLGTVETTIKAEGVMIAPGGIHPIDARVPGTLTMLAVQVGDNVKQGAILGFINDDEFKSPVTGRVLEIAKAPGSIVSTGTPLMSLELPGSTLSVAAFVPTAEGYRVQRGMPVNIKPATDDPQSASHLLGVVKSVGRVPATQVSVQRLLQNETWTSNTLAAGPVLQVNIEIPEMQPSDRIFSGLPCTTQIVVERQRPIELVLPTLSNE